MILKINLMVILTLVIAVYMLVLAVQDYKNYSYSYSYIYHIGFGIFMFFQALPSIYLRIRLMDETFLPSMEEVNTFYAGSSFNFMLLTSPLIILLSLALALSNVELMRHEGKRLLNMLGIVTGSFMLAGLLLPVILDLNFLGDKSSFRLYARLMSIYTSVYAYLECMLLGSVICCILAGRRRLLQEADYIIVLGCRVRRDGSLTPLLKGRCDRAIEQYRQQLLERGRAPILIPSGGKGGDEPLAEGQAMGEYIRSCLPEGELIVEDKSINTFENISLSKKLIVQRSETEAGREMAIAFSTSSYHVFRSGMIANDAGLHAMGIGSRTKWYFWPNAFIREFAGLMARRWLYQLFILAIVMLVYFFIVYGLV